MPPRRHPCAANLRSIGRYAARAARRCLPIVHKGTEWSYHTHSHRATSHRSPIPPRRPRYVDLRARCCLAARWRRRVSCQEPHVRTYTRRPPEVPRMLDQTTFQIPTTSCAAYKVPRAESTTRPSSCGSSAASSRQGVQLCARAPRNGRLDHGLHRRARARPLRCDCVG